MHANSHETAAEPPERIHSEEHFLACFNSLDRAPPLRMNVRALPLVGLNEALEQAPDSRLQSLRLQANYLLGTRTMHSTFPFMDLEIQGAKHILEWGSLSMPSSANCDLLYLVIADAETQVNERGNTGLYVAKHRDTNELIAFAIEETATRTRAVRLLEEEERLTLLEILSSAPAVLVQHAPIDEVEAATPRQLGAIPTSRIITTVPSNSEYL